MKFCVELHISFSVKESDVVWPLSVMQCTQCSGPDPQGKLARLIKSVFSYNIIKFWIFINSPKERSMSVCCSVYVLINTDCSSFLTNSGPVSRKQTHTYACTYRNVKSFIHWSNTVWCACHVLVSVFSCQQDFTPTSSFSALEEFLSLSVATSRLANRQPKHSLWLKGLRVNFKSVRLFLLW